MSGNRTLGPWVPAQHRMHRGWDYWRLIDVEGHNFVCAVTEEGEWISTGPDWTQKRGHMPTMSEAMLAADAVAEKSGWVIEHTLAPASPESIAELLALAERLP